MRKRFFRSEKGQAMVEFALCLPILLILVCGIIDFGWIYYNQISINNAAREGARYAAVYYTQDSDWESTAEEIMKSSMVGIASAETTVTDPGHSQITATVTAEAKVLTGFTSTILGKNSVTLYAECTMRVEN